MKNLKIKEGKNYQFSINQFGRILNYEGKITLVKENKFYLKTDEACKIEFDQKDILEIKEISKSEKQIPTIKKKTFTPKHKLKPSVQPQF